MKYTCECGNKYHPLTLLCCPRCDALTRTSEIPCFGNGNEEDCPTCVFAFMCSPKGEPMKMIRVEERPAKAYIFQPGDGTRYCAVVSKVSGYYQVAMMNEGFSDVITFRGMDYLTGKERVENVRDYLNPHTLKAAKELVKIFKGE